MQPLSPVAKRLIVIALASFVLQMILEVWAKVPVFELLVLRGGPPGVDDLWRLVSHPFVWPANSGAVFGLAFVCLGFWWMVSPIEWQYGARRTWTLVVLALAAAAIPARLVGFVLPSTILYGASAVFLASIAVYAFTLGDRTIQLFGVVAMKAMHLLYLAIGFTLLNFLVTQNVGSLVASIGAVGAGWWFVRGGGISFGRARRKAKPKRNGGRRGNLRVVGEDEDPDRPRWLN